jgi:hypothetical protein
MKTIPSQTIPQSYLTFGFLILRAMQPRAGRTQSHPFYSKFDKLPSLYMAGSQNGAALRRLFKNPGLFKSTASVLQVQNQNLFKR